MEKDDLKLTIWKTKIMASSSITLWQIDSEQVEIVTVNFIFLGPQITQTVIAAMKWKYTFSFEEKLWQT